MPRRFERAGQEIWTPSTLRRSIPDSRVGARAALDANEADAADATQEAFVDAFRNLGAFDAARPFMPALRAAAQPLFQAAIETRHEGGEWHRVVDRDGSRHIGSARRPVAGD